MRTKNVAIAIMVVVCLVGGGCNIGGIEGKNISSDKVGVSTAYHYWLPYVETTIGPTYTVSAVNFRVYENDTGIKVDKDNDGSFDSNFTGDRGDLIVWGRKADTNDFPPEGAYIESNKTVDAFYGYKMADHGAYEDGAFSYSLLEEKKMGTNYFLPFDSKVTAIVSSTDGNDISLDTDLDGTADYTNTLQEGEVWKEFSVPRGTKLSSQSPVQVVLINGDNNNYDNTTAVTVLPINLLQNEYFVPEEHPYNYQSSTDNTKVNLVAVEDDTTISIDEDKDGSPELTESLQAGDSLSYNGMVEGAKLHGSKSFYAVYLFNVYAKDPWASYRHYTSGFQLLPSSLTASSYITRVRGSHSHTPSGSSRTFINLIAKAEESSQINIDFKMNGTIDISELLERGEILTVGPNAPKENVAAIQSNNDVPLYISRMKAWNQISEEMAARSVILGRNGGSNTYQISQNGNTWAVTPISRAKDAATFYDYYSSSAHTPFVENRVSKIYFYRDSTTGEFSLIIHHSKDNGASNLRVDFDFEGIPSRASVAQSDDPNHQWDPPRGQEFDISQEPEGHWSHGLNSDGGALSGLPTNTAWSLTITPDFIQGLNTWYYQEEDNTIQLDMSEPLTISYSPEDEWTADIHVDDDYTNATDGWHQNKWDNIQDAIDNASTGNRVFVHEGIYHENISINKSIDLKGEGKRSTTIDGCGKLHAAKIKADRVNLSGFSITNGSSSRLYVASHENITIKNNNISGDGSWNDRWNIILKSCKNVEAINNTVIKSEMGFVVSKCENVTVKDNDISRNYVQNFDLTLSTHCRIHNNTLSRAKSGDSLTIWHSSKNTVSNNTITDNNGKGIIIQSGGGDNSNYNIIKNNTIANNGEHGIFIEQYSSNNLIYNNYLANEKNAWDEGVNRWNISISSGKNIIGGPYIGGNYWDDYSGYDNNGDGFGDSSYYIPNRESRDKYPLTESVSVSIPDLASHWAPVWYQDTDGSDYDADYITNFDFDGNWKGDDNWEHQEQGYPLKGNIYYWVVETDSHYFIGYAAFHPRDWYNVPVQSHENDMEGILLTIKKDGSRYGQFQLMITLSEKQFFSYTDSDSSPSSDITDAEETIDGEVEFYDNTHPYVYVKACKHGITGDERWETNGFPGDDGVVYYCDGVAEEPQSGNDRDVGYALKNINTLYERRKDYVKTFESRGVFNSPTDKNKAHAPWKWDDPDDGEIYAGTFFSRPAKLVDTYHDGFTDISHTYLYRSYKSSSTPLSETCKQYNPVIYTTNLTGAQQRVFTPEDVVKSNFVIANTNSEIIDGTVTIDLTKDNGEKICTIFSDSVAIGPHEKKCITQEIDLDSLGETFEDYIYWKGSGFNFVGRKTKLKVTIDNNPESSYEYGFYVDEYGIPNWLDNANWVDISKSFSQIIKDAESISKLKTSFENLLDKVERNGFNTIFISAEYYNYGDLEDSERIPHWFPTNGSEGGSHYTTPPDELIELCDGDTRKARQTIRGLVKKAHNHNPKIRVMAYTDIMGIYHPMDLGIAESHCHVTEEGWSAKNETDDIKRLTWIETDMPNLLSEIDKLAVRPCYVGNAKGGSDATDDDAFQPENIEEDLNEPWKNDPSYLYHVNKQYLYLMNKTKGYNFDLLFTDDTGRLIQAPHLDDAVSLVQTSKSSPVRPSKSGNGIDYSQTAESLRGSKDKDAFAKNSLANMLKYLRHQVKYYNKSKAFMTGNYYIPKEVDWTSVATTNDLDNSDQHAIYDKHFARWAYENINMSYKPLRTDYITSLRQTGGIPGSEDLLPPVSIDGDRVRTALTGIAWANHVWIMSGWDSLKKYETTQHCYSMRSEVESSNEVNSIFQDETSQDLLYHSGLSSAKYPEYKTNSELQFIIKDSVIGELFGEYNNPYLTLYRVPCRYGEKARILHVVNQRIFGLNNPDPSKYGEQLAKKQHIPAEYDFEVRTPPGQDVKNIYLVKPDNPNAYIKNLTDTAEWHTVIKNNGEIYVSVNASLDTYGIILVEFTKTGSALASEYTSVLSTDDRVRHLAEKKVTKPLKEGAEAAHHFAVDTWDKVSSVEINLGWPGSDMDLHLYSPAGNHVGGNYSDNDVDCFENATYLQYPDSESIIVDDPMPGEWTIRVKCKNVSKKYNESGEPYHLNSNVVGDFIPSLEGVLLTNGTWVKNQSSSFTLRLKNGGEGIAENISCQFGSSSGTFSEDKVNISRLAVNTTTKITIDATPLDSGNTTMWANVSYTDSMGRTYHTNVSDSIDVITQPDIAVERQFNNSGLLQPGKNTTVRMKILNTGSSTAYNISVNSTIGNQTATISSHNFTVGELSTVSNTTVSFTISLPEGSWTHTVDITYADVNDEKYFERTMPLPLYVVFPPIPSVSIDTPANGSTINKAITIAGNASNSDNSIEKVDIRIDNGSWQTASGTESWMYRWDTTAADNGNHTIYARSYDGEYYSNITRLEITVDNTPPLTNITVDPTSPEGENRWYRDNVIVTLSSTDVLSKVHATRYKINDRDWKEYTGHIQLSKEGHQSITYYSVDNAGNEENHTTVSFKIDKTKPTVSMEKPTRGLYLFDKQIMPLSSTCIIGRITLLAEASDNTSGIQSVEFFVDGTCRSNDTQAPYAWLYNERTLIFQRRTFKVTAHDTAGNQASKEREVWMFNIEGL